jgi:cellulose synthase/poly-beta-1,6-N-acetylglucosamine synthase-like glycosyltransferase
LSCGPLLELKPNSFIERALFVGSTYRRNVFAKYNNGINFFTCHGSHRALSKKLYKEFRFKGSIAEDAYSYLYCVKNNFKYAYVKDAQAYIKLPTNLKDHVSQSTRFFSAPEKLSTYFDEKFISENTKWPITLFAIEGIKIFIKYPLEAVAYALISLYVMFIKLAGLNDKNDAWKMVESSKKLRNI